VARINSELMGAMPTLAVGMLWDFSANLMPTASVGMAPKTIVPFSTGD
jgi:hypothetical protein